MRPLGLTTKTDMLGNLIATAPGDASRPSVMLFAHMDQLGFVIRKIGADGLISSSGSGACQSARSPLRRF